MPDPTEYIIVTDRTSKVLKSVDNYKDAKAFATLMRQAGGEVTIFKALEVKKNPKGIIIS